MHHRRNEGADHQRALEVADYLNQVSEKKTASYGDIHIKNYYDEETGRRVMEPADFEKQIDYCVEQIKAAIAKEKAGKTFCAWSDPVSPEQYFHDKERISIDDKVGFRRIADVCNDLFDAGYGGMQRSYFTPPTVAERYGDEYILWFPKLAIEGKAVARGWNNQLSESGLTIAQYNEKAEVKGPGDMKKRVTFVQVKDPITGQREYRFCGVFEFVDLKNDKEVYSRCADSFTIIRR